MFCKELNRRNRACQDAQKIKGLVKIKFPSFRKELAALFRYLEDGLLIL
ncbi:hypothetical protein NEOC95_001040 [Neochlamydia sp. AcF95]|nr:hypothetical protein [Neochlamydia sp. AcF95]